MPRIPARCLTVVLLVCGWGDAQTTQPQISITSAASYQQAVAPNSLATLFGQALTGATVSAKPGPDGQLPTQLAGISVEVNGASAQLIYVSPSQINFVVPESTAVGTATVVVRSSSSAAKPSGTVPVQNVVPALFSLNSTGAGPGAIFNAVTYDAPPFLVLTPENSGSDKRTRLLVYATGLRYAGNPSHDPSITNVAAHVTAEGRDPSGNVIPLPVEYAGKLPVEYAGPAPGFPGLDQVNVLLPAELDGVGSVTLTLGAESATTNPVTFPMNALPAFALKIARITLTQSEVTGLANIPATVSLNGRARTGGFSVLLQSNNPSIQVPAFATIATGSASAQFTVLAGAVAVQQSGTVQASGNGSTVSASLQLDPSNGPTIASLVFDPGMVAGGAAATGTVSLNATAPGGAMIRLSSDHAAAQVPATVNVGLGQRSAAFNITTSEVTALVTATITATIGGSSQSQQLKISPPVAVTLSSLSVVGGNSVTGTVTLATPAPAGGATVRLASSDSSAQVSALGLVVPSGQTAASFIIQTIGVSFDHTATITASYASMSGSAVLTVKPLGSVTLESLSLNPSTVMGGGSVTATVTLTDGAPMTGVTVLLSSSNPFAQLPSFVAIAPGMSSADFTIRTIASLAKQTATITATYQSVTKKATLTIQ